MNWTSDDRKNVSFSDELAFYVLKPKNQCKIWRLEKREASAGVFATSQYW